MLSIDTNDWTLSGLLGLNYKNPNYYHGGNYIYSINVGVLNAPFKFNDIKMKNYAYKFDNADNFVEFNKDKIISGYNELEDDELFIYRIESLWEANKFEEMVSAIDTDIFIEIDETYKETYTKAMQQYQAREDLDTEPTIKVYISRVKHMIVIINTHHDASQETDYFLTIGMVHHLFPDWADKWTDLEKACFNELIHRSQLKRIVNSDIQKCYNELFVGEPKYKDKIAEIKFNNLIENVVTTRIRKVQTARDDSEIQAEAALRNYTSCKRKFYEAAAECERLKENQDEYKQTFIDVFNYDYINNVNCANDIITFNIDSTLQFYDTDLAELSIKHVTDDRIIKFIKDVFIDGKYKMHARANFTFELTSNSNNFRSPSQLDRIKCYIDNIMFNPHFEYFSCLGNYKPQLIDAMVQGDIVAFVNIALASTKSINFADGAVTGRWYGDITRYLDSDNTGTLVDWKCLEAEDGTKLSIRELVTPQPETTEETTEQVAEVRDVLEEFVW